MGHLVGFQKKREQKSIFADGTLGLLSKKAQKNQTLGFKETTASREDQSTREAKEMVSLPAFFENKTSDQLITIKKQI